VEDGENESVTLPKNFSLAQNFPNPFNPVTTIKFKVQSSKFKVPLPATLKIYNLLGQKVRTLVDELKATGEYEVVWDGKDDNGQKVGSGIYFYQLKTGESSESKKMVLLK
jgi:flagellar hook assembly protein FlgD